MKSSKFNRRHFIIIVAALVVAFVISFFAREYIANIYVGNVIDEIELPTKSDRVLVFAPHSDDEALGAAELIKKSIQNGAEVKVVLATNGDGFTRAVAIEYKDITPTPADYIRYGYIRQAESRAALIQLGVKDQDILFLGYPDGGISKMWSTHWMTSNPYVSSFTKTNKSPYNDNYDGESLYSGESLFKDITKIISDFQPTHVVYPHPNDRHPDHWALNAFVKYSMKCINYTPKHEWLYLVHRGDWPTPLIRDRNIFLVPPMSLYNIGTRWLSLSMTDLDIEEKSKIFKLYKSQIKRIGPLMAAFERKNELFGSYDNAVLVKNLRNDSEVVISEENRIVEDPAKDAINLEVGRSSDLLDLHAEVSKENNLHVYISLNSKPDSLTTYHLNMIFMNNENVSPLNLIIKGKSLNVQNQREASIVDISDIQFKIEKNDIHIIMPNNKAGDYNSIFMNAESFLNSFFMDKTAWRIVDAN